MPSLGQEIVDAVARVGVPLIYLVVLLLALGETAIFADLVVPGEIGMLVAAAAAARADGRLWVLIAAGTLGAIVGDSVSYGIGRRWGLAAVCRWDWTRRLLEPKARRAQEYFEERGGVVVLVARWVGALRAVVPVVVGTARMPFPRFLFWNVAGSATWGAAVISLGWFVGRRISGTVGLVATVISGIVVGSLLLWWTIRWWRGRRRGRR